MRTADAAAPRWAERARALRAEPVDSAQGLPLLAALWGGSGRLPSALPSALQEGAGWERLAAHLAFARVGAGATLIEQDEGGAFLLVLLEGSAVIEHHGERAPGDPVDPVDRAPGRRRPLRLAEARPGDVMGEMSLLDAGPRSSACVTRSPCLLAVLEVDALQRLMLDDPALAAPLLAAVARRLSLRLRQADARLAVLLSGSD
jgi:CRP-like cAMP-binding protein